MFTVRGAGAVGLCRHALAVRRPAWRLYSTKSYDPLRILFCGSDEFSIASLKALHAYHLKEPSRITSIDVVCRPGKRVGRGLKTIREGKCNDRSNWARILFTIDIVPIKEVASNLSLPIHEVDTFTGWKVRLSYSRLLSSLTLSAASDSPSPFQLDYRRVIRTFCTFAYLGCCEVRRLECSSIFTTRVSSSIGRNVP